MVSDLAQTQGWLYWKFVCSASIIRVSCRNLMVFMTYWSSYRIAVASIVDFIIFSYIIIILVWQKIQFTCFCCGLGWLRRLFWREGIKITGSDLHTIYVYYIRLNPRWLNPGHFAKRIASHKHRYGCQWIGATLKRHNQDRIIKKSFFYFGSLICPYYVNMSIN